MIMRDISDEVEEGNLFKKRLPSEIIMSSRALLPGKGRIMTRRAASSAGRFIMKAAAQRLPIMRAGLCMRTTPSGISAWMKGA